MKTLRYALEALGLHLLYGIFWALPLDSASWLGGKLGERVGPFTKGHKTAGENLAITFPDMSEAERKTLLRKMWNHFGRIIAEYPHLEQIGKTRIKINNVEILENAITQKSSAIFATGHIGNWEANAAYLMTQYGKPVHITYRALNNPINDKLLYNARTMNGKIPAYPKHKKSGFSIVRALKEKQLVAFMIDQKFNEGLAVPFFDRPAMTNPVFAQLAQKHNAPIIMLKTVRTHGANFEITLYEPLKTHTEDSIPRPLEDIIRSAHILLEDWIKEQPHQWLWMHNRWDSAQRAENTPEPQTQEGSINHGTL